MNTIKKMLLAIAFTGAFAAATSASAETITSTYDPADVTLSTAWNATHSISFTQSISTITNGFVVGFDKLNSAFLSIFLKDDQAQDGYEAYKFTLGTQTFTGDNLNDQGGYFNFSKWPWTWVPVTAGSVTEVVNFNPTLLTDLRTDGAINVKIEATYGDFIFDKAVLTADITRGIAPPAAVPEPATVALLGLGLFGVAASRRKSAKSKNA